MTFVGTLKGLLVLKDSDGSLVHNFLMALEESLSVPSSSLHDQLSLVRRQTHLPKRIAGLATLNSPGESATKAQKGNHFAVSNEVLPTIPMPGQQKF